MSLSDTETKALAVLRRDAAVWPRARWGILVLSLSALLFGLFPWTRVMFGADPLAEAPPGARSHVILAFAVLWAEQSIAAVIGAFGLFVVIRNWRGKPERTVLLAVVDRLLAAEIRQHAD